MSACSYNRQQQTGSVACGDWHILLCAHDAVLSVVQTYMKSNIMIHSSVLVLVLNSTQLWIMGSTGYHTSENAVAFSI